VVGGRRKTRRRNDFGLGYMYEILVSAVIYILDNIVPGFAEHKRHVFHVRHVYPGLLVNDVSPQFFHRALELPAPTHAEKHTRSIKGKFGGQNRYVPNTYWIDRRIKDLLL